MTLLECLESLPDSLVMRDLAATTPRSLTVAELKQKYARDPGSYQLHHTPAHYGKSTKAAIRVENGSNVLIEDW